MSWRNRALGALAIAGVGAVAGRVAVKRSAKTVRERSDPRLDGLYDLPDDVVHHEIPSADGGMIHAIEKGEGRPLLLVHGITLQSSVWAPQFQQLTDRFRVIAIDVRGHGRSRAGSDKLGRAPAARDIATVLEHFDLCHAIVVGHSMGGMITMVFAGNHADVLNERVDGLVFMDTAVNAVLPPGTGRFLGSVGGRAVRRLESGRRVPNFQATDNDTSLLFARMAFGADPPAKAVEQVRKFLEEVPQTTSLPSGVDLALHDARPALRATKTPSLVLVGSRDLLTPVFAAKRIKNALPNARLVVLPRAGHQLMQERPFEVAALLDEFAAELPPYEAVPPASTAGATAARAEGNGSVDAGAAGNGQRHGA
ncbi:MAG: alpha/beta hydrolase [Acidimicrobiales bacterium]